MNKNERFLPILLGSDRNVYGMAYAFNKQYNIKSIALGKSNSRETMYSKILTIIKEPSLESTDVFIKTLLDLKKQYLDTNLILIACSDIYMKLVINNKELLENSYIIPYVNKELMNKLVLKDNFYKICDKYNLKYPKTETCNYYNYKEYNPSFNYPIIIKPSNTTEYWKCNFEGKNKIYICKDNKSFWDITSKIYNTNYKDTLIVQEYIPGNDTYLRVLNAYVDTNNKVTFMGLGQVLLEEKEPKEIGDYGSIITTYNKDLFNKIKQFLESIKYVGYANFDFKIDPRTGEYVLFEINLRQGRSSSFTTVSGYNIVKYLIDDVIYKKHRKIEYLNNEHVWTVVPKKILNTKLQNIKLINKINGLYKDNKVTNIFFYKKDMTIKRFFNVLILMYNTEKRYNKYYKK